MDQGGPLCKSLKSLGPDLTIARKAVRPYKEIKQRSNPMADDTKNLSTRNLEPVEGNRISYQSFKGIDTRILRECLSGIFNIIPPIAQTKVHTALKYYATRISEYCKCKDYAYVARESKNACLDCGRRFDLEKDLEVVE